MDTLQIAGEAVSIIYSDIAGTGNKQITVTPPAGQTGHYIVMCNMKAEHIGGNGQDVSAGVKLYRASSSGGTQNPMASSYQFISGVG